MLSLSDQLARGFYAVHKERSFYGDLVKFMTSGPVVPAVLEGESAIARWRELLGPTDSTKAPKGTIRGDFGTDVERNACHGSDAPQTARVEIAYHVEVAAGGEGAAGSGQGGGAQRPVGPELVHHPAQRPAHRLGHRVQAIGILEG
jgi:nucleoside diphosphate kinase